MPIDVFISYAHATMQAATRQLRDELSKDGLKVFLDEREIPYGSPFPRDIADGLLGSRLAIVFADDTYFRRPWCVYEFQVITAPYRAAGEVDDKQLEHVAVALPESGDIATVVAHLPPPLARVSWPTANQIVEVADMIRDRLQGLTSTLASRLSGVNDDAVERLRAGGDIPWAWAKAPIARINDAGAAKPARPQCIDLAPETRGEEFIGRGAELWRVFHHLVTCRAFSTPPACAIQDLGGSGKSQLAAEFIARYGERFFPGGVIWVSADGDAQTLADQFRGILQAVSPGSPDPATGENDPERRRDLLAAALAKHFSSAASGNEVLWVVDGVPEPSGDRPRKISYWCPALNCVHVLATSRRTGLEDIEAYVQLGGLATSSAVELLTRPNVDRRWLKEEEWKDLADWVGGLPLAISILRAGLSDGFTTAAALKLARGKDPSVLLDREMDALRGEVEDERLRGVTEAFDFSYRTLEQNAELCHAAHLLAQLAPYPLAESVLACLVPSALIGRLAMRSWIQASAAPGTGQVERRWIMHRIPASFLRARTANAQKEYADLFDWLGRMVAADLAVDNIRTLEYHLAVIRRGMLACLPELGGSTSPAVHAAHEFAVTAVVRYMAGPAPMRQSAGFRFLAAGLANELGGGNEVAACLEQAYETGDLSTIAAIPHTLQALVGNSRAVELMGRLIQDRRDQVRYQALVHAHNLRSLDLALPLLEALLKESTADLDLWYDYYLDNRCPALREILSELAHYLNKGTPRQRERAALLLGRALLVNGKALAAGGFTSRHVVGGLLRVALDDDSESVVRAAVLGASHYFDDEAYNLLSTKLAHAQDSQRRARVLAVLGEYLAGTCRPSPPKMEVKRLDSGGIRIQGQLGQAQPLPPGVYNPLIEAAVSEDPLCAPVAAHAILATSEGKIAAGEAAHQLLDAGAYDRVGAMAGALAEQESDFTNVYWWRSQARQALGDAAGAIADYSTVIQQVPGFADAYLNRGQLLLRFQRFGSALPDLLRTGELDPQLFAAHHLAALCLCHFELYSEAEAAANRAIALAPQVGKVWFVRGLARYSAGHAAEALQDVRRAVELDPSDEGASQLKAQLEADLGGLG